MAELTAQQKKDYARMLYLKDNLTQQEIAEKVGVSRQSVIRWMKAEKWEEMKVGVTLSREQQISNLHRQVMELNNVILSRPEGERYATAPEADTLGKLAAAIKKMETDVGIADLVSVGIRFIEWIRPIDLDKAKEIEHSLLYNIPLIMPVQNQFHKIVSSLPHGFPGEGVVLPLPLQRGGPVMAGADVEVPFQMPQAI